MHPDTWITLAHHRQIELVTEARAARLAAAVPQRHRSSLLVAARAQLRSWQGQGRSVDVARCATC